MLSRKSENVVPKEIRPGFLIVSNRSKEFSGNIKREWMRAKIAIVSAVAEVASGQTKESRQSWTTIPLLN